jgi:hypothetical protein
LLLLLLVVIVVNDRAALRSVFCSVMVFPFYVPFLFPVYLV